MHGQLYLNGQFVDASSKETFAVVNPYNLEEIGQQAKASKEDVEFAIDSAEKAFKASKEVMPHFRAKYLRALHDLLLENIDEMTEIMTLEQGKPLKDAKGEVRYAASYLQWYAEEGIRIQGDSLPSVHKNYRIHITKEPVGIAALLTPWNFPLAMFVRKMAAAIAAGCVVIVKPSSQTPFTAVKFFELVEKAKIPAGVCQLLTGDAGEIADVLLADKRVRKVSFTGSDAVGQEIASKSAKTMKKVTLELGGHAPFILMEDANLERALSGLMMAKFRNTGQACIAANRLYVHHSIKDKFLEMFIEKAKDLKLGNGMEKVDIGPVINKASFDKLQAQVDDAVAKGAVCLLGGKGERVNGDGGYLFPPTVLDNVTTEMKIAYEESFGPVLAVFTFDTVDEVLEMANDTEYGLAAYAFTESLEYYTLLTEGLEFGMVAVNTGALSVPQGPFGGIKMSGYGSEGGTYGINEFLKYKMVNARVKA